MRNVAFSGSSMLAGASAAAIVFGGGAITSAQANGGFPATSDAWWFSAEGQFSFWDGSDLKLPEFGSSPFLARYGGTFGGAIGYRPAGSDWWYALRGRYGKSRTVSKSFYNYDDTLDTRHREEHAVVDFEVGREVGLGSLGPNSTFSVKGGIRFAWFNARSSLEETDFKYSYEASLRRRFIGAGPRLGFEGSLPFDGTDISFDFSAAGAILFGKRRSRVSAETYYYFQKYGNTYTDSRSRFAIVPNVEGIAGFSWHLGPGMTFMLGYRVDAYFDVLDGAFFSRKRDRIVHGPMASFTVSNF